MVGKQSGVELRVFALAEDVGGRHQPAEVGIAITGRCQQGQMSAALKRHLAADDGLDVQRASSARELHRPAEVVVVRQRQGWIPKLFGADQQFLNGRCPLLEGVVAVAVELSVLNHRSVNTIHVLPGRGRS